jgi:hypothetical protein
MNTDTPLPPDVATGENPPDGAVIDYYLAAASSSPVTLEIKDAAGKTVRTYSSADKPEPIDPMLNIPTYWLRPSHTLSSAPGMHRWLWDMHYTPLAGVEADYPISAVPHNTAPQPTSPWAMPGRYTVVLTANGKTYAQPLTVRMDPRVKTPTAGLEQQFKLSQQLYTQLQTLAPAVEQANATSKQLKEIRQKLSEGTLAAAVDQVDQKVQAVAGGTQRRPGPGTEPLTLGMLRTRYLALLSTFQQADVAPTTQGAAAVGELEKQLPPLIQTWEAIKTHDLPALNQQLKGSNLPEIKLEAAATSAKATVSSKDKDEE